MPPLRRSVLPGSAALLLAFLAVVAGAVAPAEAGTSASAEAGQQGGRRVDGDLGRGQQHSVRPGVIRGHGTNAGAYQRRRLAVRIRLTNGYTTDSGDDRPATVALRA